MCSFLIFHGLRGYNINTLSPIFRIHVQTVLLVQYCDRAGTRKISHVYSIKKNKEMTILLFFPCCRDNDHNTLTFFSLQAHNRTQDEENCAWRNLTLPWNSGICWSASSDIWNFNSFNWSLYIFCSLINDICSFSFIQPWHLFSDIFCSSMWYAR